MTSPTTDDPRATEAMLAQNGATPTVRRVAAHALSACCCSAGAIWREAEHHARNAVRLAPTDPRSHSLMGLILTEAQRPQAGEHHYRRVMELIDKPGAVLLANLAWNLKNQGRMAESRALYEQSVGLDPGLFNTLYGWARMEEADRQYDRAGELLDAAEQVSPGHPQPVAATRGAAWPAE